MAVNTSIYQELDFADCLRADLVELAAQVRIPMSGSRALYAMRDRVKDQLQVMCGGLNDSSDSAVD